MALIGSMRDEQVRILTDRLVKVDCLIVCFLSFEGVEMVWEIWKPKRSSRSSTGSNHEVMISKDKEGRICIYFNDKALKRLGWKKADRVQIQFDHQDKLIGLERNNHCGNVLSASGNTGKKLRVVFTLPSNLANVCANGNARYFTSEEWIATEDHVFVVNMLQKTNQ